MSFSWKKLGGAIVDTIAGGLIGGPVGSVAGASAGAGALATPSLPDMPAPPNTAMADAAATDEQKMLARRRGAAATRLFGGTSASLSTPYVAAAQLLGQ